MQEVQEVRGSGVAEEEARAGPVRGGEERRMAATKGRRGHGETGKPASHGVLVSHAEDILSERLGRRREGSERQHMINATREEEQGAS